MAVGGCGRWESARPLRIAMVCYPTYGGSGVVASELGRVLADRGHEVHFICYQVPARLSPLPRNIRFHPVDVVSYPLFRFPPYTLALATEIARVHATHCLDVVHVHYAVPHSTAAYLARSMTEDGRGLPGLEGTEEGGCGRGFKVVTTLHGTDIELLGRDPSYRPVTAWSLTQSNAVTAVSKFLAQSTREQVADVPIEVIYNFVDGRHFRPRPDLALRREFADDDELILCHVSNFRSVKRPMDVVDLFARLNGQTRTRLLLVGDGPERQKVFAALHRRDLLHKVHFASFSPTVQEYFQVADLFVLTSSTESFGLAALEAMACGVPVLGYAVGGLPEVVDRDCGILVPLGDMDELVAAARRLLENRDLRRRMGEAGRRRAREVFDPQRIASRYEQLYARLLTRSRSPRATIDGSP